MNLISKKSLLDRIRRSRQARARLVENNLSEGIAFQIRATRDKRNWTQIDLARESGMKQNNISRMESPDYGKHSVSSLKRIADALDVALMVRFVPFSQYIDWLSGMPHLDKGISPEALAVPSFADESNTIDLVGYTRDYWCVTTTVHATTTVQQVNGMTDTTVNPLSGNVLPYGASPALENIARGTSRIAAPSIQMNVFDSLTPTSPRRIGEKVA
jgi:DNA-binding Xre family transcriptional regulator